MTSQFTISNYGITLKAFLTKRRQIEQQLQNGYGFNLIWAKKSNDYPKLHQRRISKSD